MAKQFSKLLRIENETVITAENQRAFLFHLQTALLMALLERGCINDPQCCRAEALLKNQFREQERRP